MPALGPTSCGCQTAKSQQLLRSPHPRRRFYCPSSGSRPVMRLSVAWQPSVSASASPWRVLDEGGQEAAWANTFLDAQRIRHPSLVRCAPKLSTCSVCTSPFGERNPPLSQTAESTLLDYARHHLDQQPKSVSPRTCVLCAASETPRPYDSRRPRIAGASAGDRGVAIQSAMLLDAFGRTGREAVEVPSVPSSGSNPTAAILPPY